MNVLAKLDEGEIQELRTNRGGALSRTVTGFDLFSGLWWPLRENNTAPRREVSWLAAKLYSSHPETSEGSLEISEVLRSIEPQKETECKLYRRRIDSLLRSELADLEPHLAWAIATISKVERKFDWAALIADLSNWENTETRRAWAQLYLNYSQKEEENYVN